MLSGWHLALCARWEVSHNRHDRRERGASLVEYALLVSLIALVCVAAISFFGSQESGSLSNSANSIVG